MKKIAFDADGSMTVTKEVNGIDVDGKAVVQTMQHSIQASQLKAHLPMFIADMSAAEKAEANAIIAAQ